MSRWSVVVIGLVGCLVSGCVGLMPGSSLPDQPGATVIFQPSETDMILSCLAEREGLTRNEMRAEYAVIEEQVSGNDTDSIPHLICLSLHRQASYQQFKDGMEYLADLIDAKPDQAASLRGILILAQRIDREKISRWTLANRNLDEKEGLEAENRELLERNEALKNNAVQDQARITELQNQIEQLKDIENILKSRER
ncbi:hypothetical protein [Desulfobulbus alkaliphilus]|uniref:hypothetical protein n=1 Tax=Desulfobulbus alkaliphilus TaxID=869814 RepID=UPI001964A736|nr:hypothetical protein [Desulfobulbus alkaliphilus]MBM9538111.1 hypothetical protein [Desulfobulbus alkaliphilus]